MNDILSQIARNKRAEVDAIYATNGTAGFSNPFTDGLERLFPYYEKKSFAKAITAKADAGLPGIIAEFKRRSPSKGDIAPMADVTMQVVQYERGGAACCSVLTDTRYFGGSCYDLARARKAVSLPLLRKDFIVSELQIYETLLMGADAILLIASILDRYELRDFTELAHLKGLEVLFEIHHWDELDKMPADVDMVGVNNRRLASFETDVTHAGKMISYLPNDKILIAESGIRNAGDIKNLREAGFQGFLIGETFMRSPEPEALLKDFMANG